MNAETTPASQARAIIRGTKAASLGTLTEKQAPFLSLVTVAAVDGRNMAMLLSGLAVHTRNLRRDPRCSLLLVEPGGADGNPLAGARLTLTGTAICLDRSGDVVDRAAFLERHPEAAMYADFGDFAIWRFEIEAAHLVAGFGRIVSLRPEDLVADD